MRDHTYSRGRMRPRFSLLLLVGLVACAYRKNERVISVADVTNPARTKITNYLSAPLRPGSPSESAPPPLSRAAVVDEATIARLDASRVCFRVVVRTLAELDSPLSEWRAEVGPQRATIDDETVTIRDYETTGERNVVVADAVTTTMLASLRVTEPTKENVRVFERAGTTCAARPPGQNLTLSLVLPMDDNRGNWGETFEWTIAN